MDTAVVLALVTGAFGFLTVLLQAIMTYIMARLNNQQIAAAKKVEQAAVKVEDVKKDLQKTTELTEKKLDNIVKVANDTHTLVNSNMGVQLRLNAELSRWKAESTKTPEDEQAAVTSEGMYQDHLRKQAVVDKRKKTD